MSGGLIIRLRPHEKFLINGCILENGDKRAKLRVKTEGANILRLRDALHPSEATTPVKRLYYVAQLIVTGDITAETALPELAKGFDDLYNAITDEECREQIDHAREHLDAGEYYRVLRALKSILPYEEKVLLYMQVNSAPPANNSIGDRAF